MSDREQIGFRFPPGTRARVEAQRLERESLMGVLLRGLDLLEQQQPDHHQGVDVAELARRVTEIERRLDGGKPETAPAVPQGEPAKPSKSGKAFRYPEAAKRRAVEMHRAGHDNNEIAATLAAEFGRTPSNLTLSLSSWAADVPEDDGSAV